jgi:hypothetical protein
MSSLERVPAPIEFYPGRSRSRMEVAHAQEH